MKLSYSRIGTFKQCPYQFKLKYIDGLRTKFNLDPTNALVLGTAVHTGIEKDIVTAIKEYYANYPSVTPLMVNEAIKLEVMIRKAREILPKGKHELSLEDDDFIGYMDLLVDVGNGEYDLYDFKYSNNVKNYLESGQLHVYKYWFEKLNKGKKIRNMYFVFIPKVKLKNEFDDMSVYRNHLKDECEKQNIRIEKIEFDYRKVIEFLMDTKHCLETKEFNKNETSLCWFCDYKNYCQSNGKRDGNIIYPENKEEQ